jgi:hypothetical protein
MRQLVDFSAVTVPSSSGRRRPAWGWSNSSILYRLSIFRCLASPLYSLCLMQLTLTTGSEFLERVGRVYDLRDVIRILVRSYYFSSILIKLTINEATPRSIRGIAALWAPPSNLQVRLHRSITIRRERTRLLTFQKPYVSFNTALIYDTTNTLPLDPPYTQPSRYRLTLVAIQPHHLTSATRRP